MHKEQKGQALLEGLIANAIIIFLSLALIECARLMAFKTILASITNEVTRQIALQQIFLEENGMLKSKILFEQKIAYTIKKSLSKNKAFLFFYNHARNNENENLISFIENHGMHVYFHYKREKNNTPEKPNGIYLNVVTSLPVLFSHFFYHAPKTVFPNNVTSSEIGKISDQSSGVRNALGMFSRESSFAWRIRAAAYTPLAASGDIYQNGFSEDYDVRGLDTKEIFLLSGSERHNTHSRKRVLQFFKFEKPKFVGDNESGQAMLTSLLMLAVALIFSLYFLFMAETYHKVYSSIDVIREEVLKKNQIYAQTLNEIAINNKNILSALALSGNAFVEAVTLSMYQAYAQPYWTGNKIIGHPLSHDTQNKIKNIFNKIKPRVARGFWIAQNLAIKNKSLISRNMPLALPLITQLSNVDSFCHALKTQQKFYEDHDMTKLPSIEEGTYNFKVNINGCYLRGEVNEIVKRTPPVIQSLVAEFIDQIDLFDFKNELKKGDDYGEPQYGVHLVKNNIDLKTLFYLLESKNTEFTPDERYFVITKYITNISENLKNFFDREKPLHEVIHIKANITHPLLKCKNPQCDVADNDLFSSFFTPHWTSIITSQRIGAP